MNPDLAKGEYNVIQEGVEGEEEVTVTIENSKVTETSEPKETKAPVNEIIEVGSEDYTGTFETKKTSPVEFETEYVVDNSLEPGTTKVEQEGELGEKETPVTHKIVNGQVTESVDGETKQTKAPVKRIVKVGPAKTDGTHEYTNTIPYEVEIRVNPELGKDERKVVQKGELGEEKYTLTIENSKVTKTSEAEITKQPVKEIIEVGSEDYTSTFETTKTEPVQFETEYVVDNSLEPGTTVVEQEGQLGEKETTVTHTIKNGEVIKSEDGETKQTKAPTKKIVKVGPDKTDGTHKVEEKVEIPFETVVEFDDSLAPGEQKVTQEGALGEKTRTTTLTIENSKVIKTEVGEFETTKQPVKQIIKVGRNTDGKVEHKEEIPFKYVIEYDPSIEAGKYVEETPGRVGERITTWVIKNSEVVEGPKTVETKPIDAVIKVGSKDFTGTFETKYTKPVEFETEYIEDESLEPGKTVVDQEGKLGEDEITVTHTIENGKITKSEEGTPRRTKDPVKRIVRVGAKPADSTEGETTKTIEREIPFETEVIYDENLDAGSQVIEKEGKPGKEEVTITQKVEDSKPVGDPTETTKTITEKEDRVVRVGTKPIVKEVELGRDIEYRYNPDLAAGETKTIEEGSNGSVKYTTTFNKETGKVEVKEERTEPTNKIVEYGSKTDGEFTFESEQAFDIIIRENPDLEAGKTNVIQEGVTGKTETTVKIENSKEVSRDTKIITEKQDKIIEIGTKNVCEIPPETPEDPKPEEPKPENPKPEYPDPVIDTQEIPFNTVYEYDENLDAGTVQETTSGQNGEVTITTSYDKETNKLVVDKDIVEPITRVVRIGTKPVSNGAELPFLTEYQYDPNLQPGEQVVDQEGKAGEVVYTTVFNKETGQFETKEERTEPVKEIIRYGAESEGTVTVEEELPYGVQIVPDDSLPAGDYVVDREGVFGKKSTTITIENGVETGRSSEPISDPQDMIIRVGTQCKEMEDAKEHGVVLVNYVDQDGLPIAKSIVSSVDIIGNEYDTRKDKLQTIEFDGKTYEFVKVQDGDAETGSITGPLTEVTYVYKLKEDPEVPENPEEPEKPGEPNEPGIPGEDPEKPGKDPKPEDPTTEKPDDKPTPEEIPGHNSESEGTEKPGSPDKSEEPQEEGKGDNTEDGEKPGTPDKEEKDEKPSTSDQSEKSEETDKTEKDEDSEEADDLANSDKNTNTTISSGNSQVIVPRKQSNSGVSRSNTRIGGRRTSRSANKNANDNVKTGVSGMISVAAILAAASVGLYASKKEDEE